MFSWYHYKFCRVFHQGVHFKDGNSCLCALQSYSPCFSFLMILFPTFIFIILGDSFIKPYWVCGSVECKDENSHYLLDRDAAYVLIVWFFWFHFRLNMCSLYLHYPCRVSLLDIAHLFAIGRECLENKRINYFYALQSKRILGEQGN